MAVNKKMNEALDMYITARDEYKDIFGDSSCGYDLCFGGRLTVSDNKTHTPHVMPDKETAKVFIDRIQRSIAAGRNLFFEEWPAKTYRRDVIY